jgi:hypothetical protein
MSDQVIPQKKNNPLSGFYRQPKIYIKLPSSGRFYPEGSLDLSSTGDYPVFAMTAKDELMFKTPDALLSGQSTVEVIKSCIPAILDPWRMPSIDLDVCLIAIRIATYGDNMELTSECPSCKSENEYDINLSNWLEKFVNFQYRELINHEELKLYVRPYTYQEVNKNTIKTFEQQRIFSIVNDENISDEEKIDKFSKSFVKLTELTVDIVAGCISKIETPTGSTDDHEFIMEFINNCPRDIFDKISQHITDIKETIELKPQDVVCTHCNTEYILPITMDQSNFFAVRS